MLDQWRVRPQIPSEKRWETTVLQKRLGDFQERLREQYPDADSLTATAVQVIGRAVELISDGLFAEAQNAILQAIGSLMLANDYDGVVFLNGALDQLAQQ